MQYYPELFNWWAASISFSVLFMTLCAVYLYVSSRVKRRQIAKETGKRTRLASSFIFVWILLVLLVLYVASIDLGSYTLYVLGNVTVELLLIVYAIKNRSANKEVT